MKKSLLIAGLFFILFSTTHCTKETITKIGTEISSPGKNEGDEIIKYNNNFLKKAEKRETFLRNVAPYLEDAEKVTKGEQVIGLIKPMFIDVGFDKVTGVPGTFGASKSIIEQSEKTADEKFAAIKNGIDDVEKYLSAEDFKDDNGQKFQMLKTQILNDLDIYDEAYNTAMDKIEPAAVIAEESLLKDHPLKDEIINSKKALSTVEQILQEIQIQYEEPAYNPEKLDLLYQNLEKLAQVNASMKIDPNDSKVNARKDSYERYNLSLESFLGEFRKFLRDSKAQNKVDENGYDAVESSYKSVFRDYNDFVD